jgi:hypothetical protein
MSTTATTKALATLLPHELPEAPAARILLYAFRRMAAHGLHDAQAAQAILGAFGSRFQRPLIALRALVADLSANAGGPIRIAPCCCCRMTSAEAALLSVLGRAERQPETAHLLLADLAGLRRADALFATALLVAGAWADLGHPLVA